MNKIDEFYRFNRQGFAVKPPCKNCTDRKLYCHSNCTSYAEFERQKAEYKKEQYKQNREEDLYISHITSIADRRKKNQWR